MAATVDYDDLARAVGATGMVVRGGFTASGGDMPIMDDGRPAYSVVVVGNIGRRMWDDFRAAESLGPNPLDRWTRAALTPIAERFGAEFVHPSDEPFRPFQRWAQRADDVHPSPIGLLVHPDHGLWHAYRGAFLFADEVVGLPPVGHRASPCLTCDDQPCLSTCPVDAFTPAIKATRKRIGVSQSSFAAMLNVSTRTLQEWEQGRRQPTGPARSLLAIAAQKPEVMHELFLA